MTDAHPSDRERTSVPVPTHGAMPDDPALDRHVVEGQIGRSPRAMVGVGARCVFGFPAVTKQAPTDDQGKPFPTAFYLTCPHLVKQIDRLESVGGVRRYEAALAQEPELMAATELSHARHRAMDERGANIAASRVTEHVKCLHAHAAFELAAGDHPLGQRVLAEAAPRWCDDARCVSLASAPRSE